MRARAKARWSPTVSRVTSLTVSAGALSGLAGGAAMLALLLASLSLMGQDPWLLPRAIAASLLGVTALVGGAPVIALGLALHLGVAAAWGVLFAMIFATSRGTVGVATMIGVFYGIMVLLAMSALVVPWADPTLRARVQLFPGTWLAAHLLYGVVLSLAPRLDGVELRRAPPLRPY
jgi:hypothetical protein